MSGSFLRAFVCALAVIVSSIAFGVSASADEPEPVVSQDIPGTYSIKNLPRSGNDDEATIASQAIAGYKETAEQRLNSEAAQDAREESVTEFADLGSSAARNLFQEVFGDQVLALLADPAEPLVEAQELVEFRDDFTAVINPEGPKDRALVVSNTPIRTDEGEIPDLELTPTSTTIAPADPLTDVTFAKNPADGIRLPAVDVEISVEDVAPNSANGTVVSANGETGTNDAAFYPNALTDTDIIATAIPGGVETFAQLRSEDSPEAITMNVDVPDGGSVVAVPDGGAEIRDSEGAPIAAVMPPFATDAQGTEVPMSMTVSGTDLNLNVPHRGSDLAYPILVDPVIEETWNWWTGTHTTYPGWAYANIGGTNYQGSTSCYTVTSASCGGASNGYGRGMFAYAAPNAYYPQNSQNRWYYTPPGNDTNIDSAYVTSWRYHKGGATNGNPFAYYGVATGYLWNEYQVTDVASGGATRFIQGGPNARQFGFGLTTNSNMTLPASSGGTVNWRYNRVSAIQLTLNDGNPPVLNPINLSGLNVPASGWISQQTINDTRSIHTSAWDAGLGIKKIVVRGTASGGGQYEEAWDPQCTAGYQDLCPGEVPSATVPVRPSALAEGVNTLSARAIDGKNTDSAIQNFTLKVDRTSPMIDLADQLAEVADEEGTTVGSSQSDPPTLTLPSYRIDVAADDRKGSATVSGVQDVEVFLDPPAAPANRTPSRVFRKNDFCSSTCPNQTATTWEMKLKDLTPGTHRLEIVVTDKAGNSRMRPVEFDYQPATGIKDEFAMQYAQFADGSEIAVNVTNGNLVYHTIDTEIQGLTVDMEVERFYNSQAPASETGEWGRGWSLDDQTEIEVLPTPPSAPSSPSPRQWINYKTRSASTQSQIEVAEDEEEDPVFVPEMRARVSRDSDGSYLVDPARADEKFIYDDQGVLEQALTPEGYAINYEYTNGGNLAEIESNELTPFSQPSAAFSYDGAYVSEVSTSEDDTVEYEHDPSGHLMSATEGVATEEYSYDQHGRLVLIEKEDGSIAEITYDGLNRVIEIELTPAGESAKVTTLAYDPDPNRAGRHTLVTEAGGREVTYLIASNGSIVKSVVLDADLQMTLAGTLYSSSGMPLTAGSKGLQISATGGNIWQAEIVIDDVAIEELSCDPDCASLEKFWTVDRDELAEGINNIRVLVTRRNGDYRDERFSVYVPPRPVEGEDEDEFVLPTPIEAAAAREAQGFVATEPTVSDLLYDSTYLEIIKLWGAPYTVPELQELQLREEVAKQSAPIIENYGAAHPAAYVGYEFDSAAGLMRVGFTHDGATHLAALRNLFPFAPTRLALMTPAPVRTAASVDQQFSSISDDQDSNSVPAWVGLQGIIKDELDGDVTVTVDDPTPAVETWIHQAYGSNVTIIEDMMVKTKSPFRAGFRVGSPSEHPCSMGYGARRDKTGTQTEGKWRHSYYVMTAGHCSGVEPQYSGDTFGKWFIGVDTWPFDAGAYRLNADNVWRVPKTIASKSGGGRRIDGVEWDWRSVTADDSLCMTALVTDTHCGKARPGFAFKKQGGLVNVASFGKDFYSEGGDSGGLVWEKGSSRNIVGIVNGNTFDVTKDNNVIELVYFTSIQEIKNRWENLKAVDRHTVLRKW